MTRLVGTICLLVGVLLGWVLWHPRAPVVEPAAPAVHQADSSLVLARRPDTTIRLPHTIPRGATPERHESIAVLPPPVVSRETTFVAGVPVVRIDTIQPPAVHIAATLVRLGDGTHRVIVSSPDGRILDSLSIDVPLGPSRAPARSLSWSAGAFYEPQSRALGAFLSRDVGPFRLMAGALQGVTGDRSGARGFLGAGIRF